MITGIRTKNFRKLEGFEASFVNGTNLLFGDNGEGKSTLFEAIRYALWGTKATSGSAESLTTWGQTGHRVELDILGHTFRRTGSGCRVTSIEDGEIVADGNSPSAKFAEKLLGCSLKDFDLLYMSKQGETAGLITFGATELNRKVEEYAGVAVIDKVIKSLGSDINGSQIALQSFEYEPVEALEKKLLQIESDGTEARNQVESLSAAKAQVEGELAKCDEWLKKANAFNRKQTEISKELVAYTNVTTRLETERDSAKRALDKVAVEFSSVQHVNNDDIDAVKAKIDVIRGLTTRLNKLADEDNLRQLLSGAEEKLKEEIKYAEELPHLESAVETARNAVDKAREANSENARVYRAATKAEKDGVCSECNRALEDHDQDEAHNKTVEAAGKLKASSAVLECAEDNLKSLQGELKSHTRTNPGTGWGDTVQGYSEQLNETLVTRQTLEAQLSELELESTLSDRLQVLVSDQKDYNRVSKEMADCQEEFERASKDLVTHNAKDCETPEPPMDTEGTESSRDSHSQAIRKINADLTEASALRATLESDYKHTRTEIASAKANNSKMSELEGQLEKSKQLRKYLNEERTKFMEGVWRTILGTASHFINKSTGGWISSVGRNDRGDFTFTENNIEAIAKESASGAQKAFIGTALKIGLAQAKMGSNAMVLLDEPTADMRDDNASKLASGLSMLPGQKIMITHRDSERMIAQNIVQVGNFNH